MDTHDTCHTLILSCYKYLEDRITKQDKENLPFDFHYFIGNSKSLTQTQIDRKIVTVNCLDYYENLPDKVYKSIEWIYNNLKFEYILKTDDDIVFNKENITKLYSEIYNSGIDYAGNLIRVSSYKSTWHKNKCENNQINNVSIDVPSTEYCSGGAYFLSKKSVEFILNNYALLKPPDLIYEDVAMGYVLSHCYGIKKAKINNLNKAFIW
jgi:hypothetical protein